MEEPRQDLKMYRELAEWFPLLTPVEEYEEEAAFYRKVFERYARRPLRTLLDLGSGAGHNAAYLKARFHCTLVDPEPAMLAINRRLNPECEQVEGDMRTLRLGRQFDCVLVHDAICYMTTPGDLARALETAYVHTAPGGVAIFQPDFTAESFVPGTETGGSDAGGRGLRFLEWRRLSEADADTYVSDMAYLLRHEDGSVETIYDRHIAGLFPRAAWLKLLAAAGFEARALPFEHSDCNDYEVFLGLPQ